MLWLSVSISYDYWFLAITLYLLFSNPLQACKFRPIRIVCKRKACRLWATVEGFSEFKGRYCYIYVSCSTSFLFSDWFLERWMITIQNTISPLKLRTETIISYPFRYNISHPMQKMHAGTWENHMAPEEHMLKGVFWPPLKAGNYSAYRIFKKKFTGIGNKHGELQWFVKAQFVSTSKFFHP